MWVWDPEVTSHVNKDGSGVNDLAHPLIDIQIDLINMQMTLINM